MVGQDAELVYCSVPHAAAVPRLGCVSRGVGHWLVWGAMECEGSLGLWGTGHCGVYYRAPGHGAPQEIWDAMVGCYGLLWGVHMGCMGHCGVFYRTYGALLLCPEGHTGSLVTPIRPLDKSIEGVCRGETHPQMQAVPLPRFSAGPTRWDVPHPKLGRFRASTWEPQLCLGTVDQGVTHEGPC